MRCANYPFGKYLSDFVTTDIVRIVKAKRRDTVHFCIFFSFWQNRRKKWKEKGKTFIKWCRLANEKLNPKCRSMNVAIWKETISTQILRRHTNVQQCDFYIEISSERGRGGYFHWDSTIGRIDYKTQIEIDRSYLFSESIISFIDEDVSMDLKWVFRFWHHPSTTTIECPNWPLLN